MSLLAGSYPELKPDDFKWIQKIRKTYDRHYHLVNPHFTLIFEIDKVTAESLSRHIRSVIKDINVIYFAARCATVMPGLVDKNWYTFLVPDEGYSDIVRLHDRLYTGILASEQRLDIPYIPHMTIGIHCDRESCKALVDKINANSFCISGRIKSVCIVKLENNMIETVEEIELNP